MQFVLIDKIIDLEPGDRITAVKCLTQSEEYLEDHFPLFPVMPGVLMLQSLFEAGAWLVRASEDFAHSVVRLKEARNIKYADFVKPGQLMTVTAQIHKEDAQTTQVKASGTVDGRTAVSGRLVLERLNLAEADPQQAPTDAYTIRRMRERFKLLYQPVATEA